MPLNASSEHLLAAFGHLPGVSQAHVDNLRNTINASPALADQLNAAVAAGHLKLFAVLPAGANAGGSYDGASKTMNLPLSIIATPLNGAALDAGEIVFVLGHEVQHGFNNSATTHAYTTFNHDVGQVAKSLAATHDYTIPVAALIAANRRDEAGAEIAGYNAVVSMARAADPKATLDDIAKLQPGRMADFLHWDKKATPPGYRPNPGLHMNADMTLAATPANVEAMGRHYFDKAGDNSHLGHNGNSDYANYYAAYALAVIAQNERSIAPPAHGAAPHITLDMKQLHLSESLVEQNGIDLGINHAPLPYYDSSSKPPTLHHLDHTAATHIHKPIEAPHPELPRSIDATDSSHAGHPLYRLILGNVERLDAQLGRTPDDSSLQVSMHLYAAARNAGLTQVTDVVRNVETADLRPGQRLFAVQGAVDDPLRRIAWIDTADALRTPGVEALRRAEAVVPSATHSQALLVGEPVQDRAATMAFGGR